MYLLIRKFGYIEHPTKWVPTGNVDIFEINCDCKVCLGKENEEECIEDNDINKNKLKDLVVFDDYKLWDKKDLRIFENPAYEYQSIIAPGSNNSYAFVIKNNNMNYKLKNNGNYLVGSKNNYNSIDGKKITNISLPAKSQKSYILDWKWIDNTNDTEIGFGLIAYKHHNKYR